MPLWVKFCPWGTDFGPLGVIFCASVSWCWASGTLFRVSTIEFEPLRVTSGCFGVNLRPFWVDYGHLRVNFGLYQMILVHWKLILIVILDLWESILKSGSLFRPFSFNYYKHWGVIPGPIGFDFWPRHVRPYNRVYKIGLWESDFFRWKNPIALD